MPTTEIISLNISAYEVIDSIIVGDIIAIDASPCKTTGDTVITTGTQSGGKGDDNFGYSDNNSIGSLSPNPVIIGTMGSRTIAELTQSDNIGNLQLWVEHTVDANTGFTTMTICGVTLYRTDASYAYGDGGLGGADFRQWTWTGAQVGKQAIHDPDGTLIGVDFV